MHRLYQVPKNLVIYRTGIQTLETHKVGLNYGEGFLGFFVPPHVLLGESGE